VSIEASPPAETRVPLTRERVLRAAVELADRDGLDAVTMRRLAGEVGVEAMSLYHHVAKKDDILGGMVDIVVGEMDFPSADGDWKAALRRSSISSHDVLVRHPWAAGLILSGPSVSTARLAYMDSILGCLRRGGFSAGMTDHAYHALDSHVMGFTLWQVGIAAGMSQLGTVEDFLRDFPVDEMPWLAEHIQQHLKERDPEDEGEFAFGLDLVLDGLERLRVETA